MKYGKMIMTVLACWLLMAFVLQTRTIKGVVLDQRQRPISGAAVQEKGTQNSVLTDARGAFSIEVSTKSATLIITALGYDQKEIMADTGKSLNIKLEPVSQTLSEVVVVGYGVQKKSFITGSVATVAPQKSKQNSALRIRGSATLPIHARSEKPAHWRGNDSFNREGYDAIGENPFLKPSNQPLSTFSIDVDGASYSNVRRLIREGQLPPAGAVRIEEMINYFTYQYPQPNQDAPFSINTEYTVCPWNEKHQLVSIGLQGKKMPTEKLPPANFVFLIDVSGSMAAPNKLPLVQASMKLLTDQLRPQDRLAIVVYAGNAGLVLPSTEGNETITIKDAIDRLQAGGSTAGGAGIELAYQIAQKHLIQNGNNRIVLCTDGDFNVGQSSDDALERLIEEKRKTGIFLTVLGFGTGNYQDAKMQKLANKGNGNHAYIDKLAEARKVLISQFGGTMFTIAKDVKLQIEFNPAVVQGYRLIGYENRMLAQEDFNDDQKDAGELGSGHTVTALYEIIPVGLAAQELRKVDDLKYRKSKTVAASADQDREVMTVKFRYKKTQESKSRLLQKVITGRPASWSRASNNLQLAAGLAQFGMLLRNSQHRGTGGYGLVEQLVTASAEKDPEGYRKELLELIKAARDMQQAAPVAGTVRPLSGEAQDPYASH